MTEEDFEACMQKMGAYGSQTDAKIALDAVVNSLMQSLLKGEDVMLEGLGTFTVMVIDAAMKGPTLVPGYPKREFYKSAHSTKRVKIKFDKALKHKINEVRK